MSVGMRFFFLHLISQKYSLTFLLKQIIYLAADGEKIPYGFD